MILVALFKWCLVIIGIIWLSKDLFKAKQFVRLASFWLAILFGVWGLTTLFQYVSSENNGGLDHDVVLVRYIGVLTDFVALWVVYRLFKRRLALDKAFHDTSPPQNGD